MAIRILSIVLVIVQYFYGILPYRFSRYNSVTYYNQLCLLHNEHVRQVQDGDIHYKLTVVIRADVGHPHEAIIRINHR